MNRSLKALWLSLGLALILIGAAGGDLAQPVAAQVYPSDGIYVAFNKESKTISSTADGFTVGIYAPAGEVPADLAVVSVEGDNLRYWVDGSTPTAAVGHAVLGVSASNSPTFTVSGSLNISRFRAIRITTDATLRVTFYRRVR